MENVNKRIEELETKVIQFIDSESGYQQRIKELEKALYYLASWYNCDNLDIDYRYCGNMEEGETCSCSECIINHLIKEIRKGKIK